MSCFCIVSSCSFHNTLMGKYQVMCNNNMKLSRILLYDGISKIILYDDNDSCLRDRS